MPFVRYEIFQIKFMERQLNHLLRYRHAGLVEVCLAGTGGFGRTLLVQSAAIPTLSVRILVEKNADIAADVLRGIGLGEDKFAVCTTFEEAQAAWTRGTIVITDDLAHVIDLPFDVLVEATGHPDAGARHARMAVEAVRHIAVVSKEVDSVIGPGLARMAQNRGRVATPVDGDQPSLLIDLITWSQVLGLEILAAGKSSEYDFVLDPEISTVTCNGRGVALPEMAATLSGDDANLRDRVARRNVIASMFDQRLPADLCELSIVANATGFLPDRPDLHAPLARIQEIPALFRPKPEGGLFEGTRVLDVFHCLRLPNELSLAGGVFVVVRCSDAETWKMLGEKGHILSPDGRTAMLTNPRHLLGVEAATTILDAAVLGETSGGADPAHHVDLVAVATADLPEGSVLAMGGHHHTIENVAARILPARALDDDAPAPFYLAANRKLMHSVAEGAFVTMKDLDLSGEEDLLDLRRMQDRLFFRESPDSGYLV